MAIGKKTGGGPKGPNRAAAGIRELAALHTKTCVEALVRIVQRSKNEGNKIAAAEQLLNRAYGKPSQQIVGDPEAPIKFEVTWNL